MRPAPPFLRNKTRYLCVAWLLFGALAYASATDPAPKKLLIVGDSLSAGYGLQEGEGWVDLLREELRREKNIRVANDSISGDTTAGGLARLPDALRRERPDWVIIELGANDGLRGQSVQVMADNLNAMLGLIRESRAQPILFGMQLPPNYGASYTEEFARAFAQVAARSNTPFLPFFLSGIEYDLGMFQADRLHPNAQAQPHIKNNVRRFLDRLWAAGE